MEDLSQNFNISRTFSLLCAMVGILSPAEGHSISEVVGNTVTLNCSNQSIGELTQLTWKKGKVNLFAFKPQAPLHKTTKAVHLNLNMSTLESELYALVIERVQKTHVGNYTCETFTASGPWEQKWELLITGGTEESGIWDELIIPAACTLPTVCILIIALTILLVCRKRKVVNNSHTVETQYHTEDIYENTLGNQQRGCNRPKHHKPMVR